MNYDGIVYNERRKKQSKYPGLETLLLEEKAHIYPLSDLVKLFIDDIAECCHNCKLKCEACPYG